MEIPKWQPLPWQLPLWDQLRGYGEQFPHALLLYGQQGVGKSHLAALLTATLLCKQSTPSWLPCGDCYDCSLLQAGHHPDKYLITPEDKQVVIKIDQIRAVTEFVYQSAHSGRRKIVIINPAEAMNHYAANALLKLLEEPPARTHWILISNDKQLPATILSRCHLLSCGIPEYNVAKQWLATKAPEFEQLDMALQISYGAPLRALALTQSDELNTYALCFEHFIKLTQNQQDPVQLAQLWQQYDLRQLLHWLYQWISDVVKLHLDVPKRYLNISTSALSLSQSITPELKDKGISVLEKICQALRILQLSQSANQQMLLENVLIAWQQREVCIR